MAPSSGYPERLRTLADDLEFTGATAGRRFGEQRARLLRQAADHIEKLESPAPSGPLHATGVFQCPVCGHGSRIVLRPTGTWTNCDNCGVKVSNLDFRIGAADGASR